MNEMINILTKGIGAELWKPIRISYYDKKRSIDVFLKNKKTPESTRNIIYDLLALTVFHDKVIIPLHGSNNFMENAEKFSIESVSMGTYSIDKEHSRISEKCVKHFFAIMSSYDISIASLTFSGAKEFVDSSLSIINDWKKK